MGTVSELREKLSKIPRSYDGGAGGVDKGGGGGNNDGMEARLAKLEAVQEFIQRDIKELKEDVRAVKTDISAIRTTDFRILFGATIAVALGLAALMAKGFQWI